MKLWEFTCLLVLLGSLWCANAAKCPDLSTAKQNLTFTERLDMATIVVYGTSTEDRNNITRFQVECVLKTDGFMIEDNIRIDYSDCVGFGDLPGYEVNTPYIALIRHTLEGYIWEFFGHNQKAHSADLVDKTDLQGACGLTPCAILKFDRKPCRRSKSDVSPLVHSVRRIFEADHKDRMISYESSPWTFLACCRSKYYPGGVLNLSASDRGRNIEPYRLRKVPKVHVSSDHERYYTVMMADVNWRNGNVEGRIKPYINWMQVNLHGNSELSANNTILNYEKPLPQRDAINHYVFLVFEQREKFAYPVALRPFASNARGCSKEYRCRFDISLFQRNTSLTLIYGSDVTCREDVYSRVENDEGNLAICKDLWPDATVIGKNMICPTTEPTDSATTARSQAMGLAVFISILLIFTLF